MTPEGSLALEDWMLCVAGALTRKKSALVYRLWSEIVKMALQTITLSGGQPTAINDNFMDESETKHSNELTG
jgi:hypothetical protein